MDVLFFLKIWTNMEIFGINESTRNRIFQKKYKTSNGNWKEREIYSMESS